MPEPISPEISDRICQHMNEDHASAIVLYAQFFGNCPETETAKMIAIDAEGMNLSAQSKGVTTPIRINFDHVLQDSEDAHHTLIEMVKTVRKKT